MDALCNAGMKYDKGMTTGKWVLHYTPEGRHTPDEQLLLDEFAGSRCFSKSMTLGGIGCALSHLSILHNAYEQGYETIWVIEDDIGVQANPHLLAEYITKLDSLIGKKEWDILYTAFDGKNQDSYRACNDFISDLKGCPLLWRPDIDFSDQTKYAKRTLLNEDFIKIGSRLQTTSMIIRRSGMKKILNFLNTHHLFFPYDLELPVIPDIKMITLRSTIVTDEVQISDTQANGLTLESTESKYQVDEKTAQTLTSFIEKYKPEICVEIDSPKNTKPQKDGSIDLLILNMPQTEKEILKAVIRYLPKIKDHGHIFVTQPMEPNKAKTIGYLMQQCTWIKEDSDMPNCVLFKKEQQTETTPSKKKKWFRL